MSRRYSLAWSDGTIAIDGAIGRNAISAAAMRRTLDELRDEPELRVWMCSGGGAAVEGMAIHDMLKAAGKPIVMTVAWAGSVSSVIAMAADRIRIVENGSFLLHCAGYAPANLAVLTNDAGQVLDRVTAKGLRKLLHDVEAVDEEHLAIFERRTGQQRELLQILRDSETVLDAATAVRLGFADEIVGER